MLWSMVSKAADRSRRQRHDNFCDPMALLKLSADEEMIWRAYMIKELVMVRDGVCSLSSDGFFRDDVLALIFSLSVS